MPGRDDRDLIIEAFADSEAELREQITTLVDLLADVTYENLVLGYVLKREMVARIHTDAALGRIRRAGHPAEDPGEAA